MLPLVTDVEILSPMQNSLDASNPRSVVAMQDDSRISTLSLIGKAEMPGGVSPSAGKKLSLIPNKNRRWSVPPLLIEPGTKEYKASL
jgi:hypothetical protein